MEINEYVLKLILTSRAMESLELFFEDAKLTKSEFRLLREVAMEREQGREIISSELAKRLRITRSAVSQIVAKLEQRGVVTRVASPTDKKIAYIRLSDSSLAVLEEQCRQANEIMDEVVARLGERKIKLLISSYDEFCETFAAVRKERSEQSGVGKKCGGNRRGE